MKGRAVEADIRTRSRHHPLRDSGACTAEILRASGLPDLALREGDHAPDLELTGVDATAVRLSQAWLRGPVVLVFYRGEWCSICMRQLRTWQARSVELGRTGATLLAISPDTLPTLRHTMAANRLSLPLLSDPALHAARAFRVAMAIPPELVDVYMAAGADAAILDEDGRWELPVPATIVVGRTGRVEFIRLDLEEARRTGPREVLQVLENIAAR
jgi:peroxiredoxin